MVSHLRALRRVMSRMLSRCHDVTIDGAGSRDTEIARDNTEIAAEISSLPDICDIRDADTEVVRAAE